MDNISCDVCRDLIPLVLDGVASPDSVQLVRAHTASCPHCRAMLEGQPLPEPPEPSLVRPVQRRLRSLVGLGLLLGVFLGIALSGFFGTFLPYFLLPLAGVCAYAFFRWKALWLLPLVLLLAQVLIQLAAHWGYGVPWNLPGLVFWSLVTALFADAGVLMAGLFHFGFRKEKEP